MCVDAARPGRATRVVMDVLGHSQLSITMDIYGHVMASALRDAADGMGLH
jgi:integrase